MRRLAEGLPPTQAPCGRMTAQRSLHYLTSITSKTRSQRYTENFIILNRITFIYYIGERCQIDWSLLAESRLSRLVTTHYTQMFPRVRNSRGVILYIRLMHSIDFILRIVCAFLFLVVPSRLSIHSSNMGLSCAFLIPAHLAFIQYFIFIRITRKICFCRLPPNIQYIIYYLYTDIHLTQTKTQKERGPAPPRFHLTLPNNPIFYVIHITSVG
jgi:hypothetical protein